MRTRFSAAARTLRCSRVCSATGDSFCSGRCRRRRKRLILRSTATIHRLMHGVDLILMLAGGLAAALIFGYFTQRLGLSPIVGYLFAGVVIGPHTPGFAADPEIAEQLAEVGVILIMFGVGLQFHV